MTLRGGDNENGSAIVMLSAALVAAALVSIVLADVIGLYRASIMASAAADASALAAASVLWDSGAAAARMAADEVATANGTGLMACSCRSRPVAVTVRMAFDSFLLARIGIDAVTARSEATMVPP